VLTALANKIEVSVRPPLAYLDHCAIRRVSSTPELREDLVETFKDRGTLMFSLVNVVEMARNTGDSYGQIRDLLDALEPYWLLSDFEPTAVWKKELQGIVAPESFFAPLDIFGMLYRNMPEGTLRLGTALEKLQGPEFRAWAEERLGNESSILRVIKSGRRDYRKGRPLRPPPFPKGSPIWIQDTLVQLLIKDGKKIRNNDVFDLLHAAVPLRYAVLVVLDKAWANFAKRLQLDEETHIFSVAESKKALEVLRTMDTSRHRVVRPQIPRNIGDPIPPGGLPLP